MVVRNRYHGEREDTAIDDPCAGDWPAEVKNRLGGDAVEDGYDLVCVDQAVGL